MKPLKLAAFTWVIIIDSGGANSSRVGGGGASAGDAIKILVGLHKMTNMQSYVSQCFQ